MLIPKNYNVTQIETDNTFFYYRLKRDIRNSMVGIQ